MNVNLALNAIPSESFVLANTKDLRVLNWLKENGIILRGGLDPDGDAPYPTEPYILVTVNDNVEQDGKMVNLRSADPEDTPIPEMGIFEPYRPATLTEIIKQSNDAGNYYPATMRDKGALLIWSMVGNMPKVQTMVFNRKDIDVEFGEKTATLTCETNWDDIVFDIDIDSFYAVVTCENCGDSLVIQDPLTGMLIVIGHIDYVLFSQFDNWFTEQMQPIDQGDIKPINYTPSEDEASFASIHLECLSSSDWSTNNGDAAKVYYNRNDKDEIVVTSLALNGTETTVEVIDGEIIMTTAGNECGSKRIAWVIGDTVRVGLIVDEEGDEVIMIASDIPGQPLITVTQLNLSEIMILAKHPSFVVDELPVQTQDTSMIPSWLK